MDPSDRRRGAICVCILRVRGSNSRTSDCNRGLQTARRVTQGARFSSGVPGVSPDAALCRWVVACAWLQQTQLSVSRVAAAWSSQHPAAARPSEGPHRSRHARTEQTRAPDSARGNLQWRLLRSTQKLDVNPYVRGRGGSYDGPLVLVAHWSLRRRLTLWTPPGEKSRNSFCPLSQNEIC